MPGSLDYNQVVNDVRDRFMVGNMGGYDLPQGVDNKGQVDTGNPLHDRLLALIKKLKTDGSDCLAAYQGSMEKADEVYRAFRVPDEDDKKADERKEPIKIIYPITYAQIQTSMASQMSIFDRSPFFPLEGRGPDFFRPSKLMELELQYQLDQTNWFLYWYQWLLDMHRFGFGKINATYEKRQSWVRGKRTINILGFNVPLGESDQLVTSFEGAYFTMDDPFMICFDPTVSIGEIQKGQYVFFQETMSKNDLKVKADAGYYYNVDNIPTLPFNTSDTAYDGGSFRAVRKREGLWARPPVSGGDTVTLDHCYVKLVPRDYGLSQHERVQIWCITMANEARIVRAEPSRFEHGMFPTAAIEYSPDIHSTLNPGMADTIDGLQETINWLINSRIANVRRVVNDRYFVAEDAVNQEDIKNRRTYIRVKKEFARLGIDKFFKQVTINDVTSQNWTDAAQIYQHLQRVTGVNDNSMGMQLPTKRPATEVSFMQRLGADRSKMLAKLIFVQGVRPLGMQMLQNTQQFMEGTRFMQVNASNMLSAGLTPQEIQQGFLNISPDQIQGMFNISMIDVTTAMDKVAAASALQELAMLGLQVPQLVPMLGLKIAQIVTQYLQLKGLKNTSDFMSPPPPDDPAYQQALMQMLSQPRPVQAQVMPEEQVMNEVQRGNLVGMPTGMGGMMNAMGGMMGGGANGGTPGPDDNFS